MNSPDLENLMNQIKNLEEMINDDNSDNSSFMRELDDVMSMLKPKDNISSLDVKIKKLRPNAVIPIYAKDGDAGLDLTATSIIFCDNRQITYGTGLSMEIPNGYVGLIFPRSSIRKMELELSNSVGVIDSGYRGEIQATFNKTLRDVVGVPVYNIGDRIAQIIIIPYPKINFVVSDELSDSERNDGGFGSTGS